MKLVITTILVVTCIASFALTFSAFLGLCFAAQAHGAVCRFCSWARFRIRRRFGLCRNRRRFTPTPLEMRAHRTEPLTFEPRTWGAE